MRYIDTHLHLWSVTSGGYRWLTAEAGALYDDFTAEQASNELTLAGVDAAVLVQADNTEADTVAMLGVAASFGWARGVVGWVDLASPENATDQLDRWQSHEAFCGIRHIFHRDDPGFFASPPVRRSLADVAKRNLPLDVADAWPGQLEQIGSLAEDIPELVIVLDHLAKPPRGRSDFDDWRTALTRVASCDQSVAKLSGLRVPGQPYTAPALRQSSEIALDLFGPSRLMWGSDWPITVPEGGYGPTFGVLRELIGTLSPHEQREIFAGTAERVYSLGAGS